MDLRRRTFLVSAAASAASFRIGPIWAQNPGRSPSGIPVIAECETVFLGATAYALGASLKNPAKTVVVEQSLMLMPEFSGALLPNVLCAAETEIAAAVRERIEKENLQGNGRYHAPPVSDVVSALVLFRKANLFLNANVADIQKTDNKFVLDIIGMDGYSRIIAERVVDTTPTAWRNAGAKAIKEKFFAAPLVGSYSGDLGRFATDRWSVVPGALPGETIFKVRLAADSDWCDARLELYAAYEKMLAKDKTFCIGGEATALGHVYRESRADSTFIPGVAWHPGAQHPDLMNALSAGELCSK